MGSTIDPGSAWRTQGMTHIGAKIGHIRIVEQLGKGGMGAVYVGVDEKLKRKVAVKAIRKDYHRDTLAKARFLREARILSQLDHPNICKIFGYVEGEDTDFLVLEFIRGESLKKIIGQPLRYSDKLKIAMELAQALAAAHANGVVHRDVKPDNVMLTKGLDVKVLDFGLSQSLGNELISESSLSEMNHPEAKNEPKSPNPEPVERSVDETATILPNRTDETRDFISPLKTAAPNQKTSFLVTLDDRNPSPRSQGDFKTRVGSLMGTLGYMSPEQARSDQATSASDMYSLGLILQELFTGRPAYPEGLNFVVQLRKVAEGDTLPVEGLEPGPTQLINRLKSPEPGVRPSAADVVDRLRWIRDKPIRRKKKMLYLAAIMILAVFAGAMTFQSIRILKEAERANREAERANQEASTGWEVSAFLESLFEVSDPANARGGDVTARELLDQAAVRIDRLEDQPLTQARFMTIIGTVYQKLGLYEPAAALFEKALKIREKHLDGNDLELARSLCLIAENYYVRDRYPEAERLGRRALAIQEKVLGSNHLKLTPSLIILGKICWRLGQFQEGIDLTERALAIQEAFLDPDHVDLAETLSSLGVFYDEMGHMSRALPVLERAVRIWERAGPDHPDLVKGLLGVGNAYNASGRYVEAEQTYRRALALCDKILGPGHSLAGSIYNSLAVFHDNQSQHSEALPYYQKALEIWENALGSDHTNVALVLDNLAISYVDLGRFAEAIALQERALIIWERILGPDNGELPYSLINLAHSLARLGRFDQAQAQYERAFTIMKKTDPADPIILALVIKNLGVFYSEKQRWSEAESFFKSAVDLWSNVGDPDKEELADTLSAYSDVLKKTGRDKDAAEANQRAKSILDDLQAEKTLN